MSTFTEEFRSWMDKEKLRAEIVGNALDVSPQTIRNWRASSVPKRKEEAVRRLMREWDSNPRAHLGRNLVVNATYEQFRAWNQAANATDGGPKLLEDWAREGLDEMAKEFFERKPYVLPDLNKVADDTPPYRTNGGNG